MIDDLDSQVTDTTALLSPQELGLSFRLENQDDLWVSFSPNEASRELSKEELNQLMNSAGYTADEFPVKSEAAAVLLDSMRRREPIELCISQPIDARVELFLSEDKLLAGMVLHGAQGRGKAMDRNGINEALKKAKVSRGLLEDVLEKLTSQELHKELLNTSQVYCTVIAYGESFHNGEDARIEMLVPSASDRRPQQLDSGRVDFFEKGDFPFVAPDTPLVRRYPATKGKSGWTVTGKTLKARDGKDLQVTLKDATVKVAEADENLYLSTVSGMPVITERGVHVEELLKLDKVDLDTGHVRFKGSIEITGDVRDEMEIIASGDIKIGGVVDAATIKAAGNIEILGGVIGHKDAKTSRKARLFAKCNISVRFAHEAVLEAQQDILVGNQVMHSELTAGGSITIQGKGQAVGGKLKAVDKIEANTTGAFAFVETRLEVGECQQLQDQYTHLMDQMAHLDEQKYQLMEIARNLRAKGREELNKKKPALVKAKEQIQSKYEHLNAQISEVEEALQRYYSARVIVHRKAFPGTLIFIAGQRFDVNKELEHVTFILQDDRIQTRH